MRFATLLPATMLPALAAALLTLPASATMVVVPSLEEMAAASDVIAHVTVRDSRVERDERGRTVTLTTLHVEEAVKGAKAGDTLEVFQIGGVLDGKGSWVSGAHMFAVGEELVFVGMRHVKPARAEGAQSVIPYGVGFGLFEVKRDDFGASVVEIVGDVVAVEKGKDGVARQGKPQVRRFDSLPGFLNLLRQMDQLKEVPKLKKLERAPRRTLAVPPAAGQGG